LTRASTRRLRAALQPWHGPQRLADVPWPLGTSRPPPLLPPLSGVQQPPGAATPLAGSLRPRGAASWSCAPCHVHAMEQQGTTRRCELEEMRTASTTHLVQARVSQSRTSRRTGVGCHRTSTPRSRASKSERDTLGAEEIHTSTQGETPAVLAPERPTLGRPLPWNPCTGRAATMHVQRSENALDADIDKHVPRSQTSTT
jgi:hypothetical protein